jgi:hypothetical protein
MAKTITTVQPVLLVRLPMEYVVAPGVISFITILVWLVARANTTLILGVILAKQHALPEPIVKPVRIHPLALHVLVTGTFIKIRAFLNVLQADHWLAEPA